MTSRKSVSELIVAADHQLVAAMEKLQVRFPCFQLAGRKISGSGIRYVLISDVTFVEFSWFVRDGFHITCGPSESGGVPGRVFSPKSDEFSSHYSIDVFSKLDGAPVRYNPEWRKNPMKAVEALMLNARVFLNGDWSSRASLERVFRPDFAL